MPDTPTGPADPVLVPYTPPELSYRTMRLAFITNSKNSLAMAERYHL